MTLIYNDFMNNKSVIHNNKLNDWHTSLTDLVNHKVDMASYDKQTIISLLNVDKLVEENNTYILKYEIPRECDIIDNFSFSLNSKTNMNMRFRVGFNVYNNLNEIVLISTTYHAAFVEFIFSEKPNIDFEITLNYRCIFLKREYRKLLRKSTLLTTNIKYEDELTTPIDNFLLK